jgi:Gram-negative bacterial tonB protein.
VINPPPENKDLDEKRVDIKTAEGKNDDGMAPLVEVSHTKVMEASKKRAAIQDTLFYKVDIEAMFPGGEAGWAHYIKKAIEQNIDELIKTRASGVCRIRFIVSKDGSVSDVEALTMKGTKLAEVAINAIRKGPDWIPAKQHGRFVNAFREQPVTFTIQNQ